MKKFVLIAMAIGVMATVTANAALIHHWDFEGTANDTGTLANAPGILYGDATYAPGQVGQAISLDGNGDFILADVTNVVGTVVPATDYTLAAWVYWDGANSMRGKIAGGQLSGGAGEVFTLSRSADGTDRKLFTNLLPNNATSVTESADNTVSTGSWMHVAYTLSSTEGTKLYLDGEVVGSNAALTTHTSAENFGIGVRADVLDLTKGIYYFDGLIDDVRIYDTALQGSDIADLATIPEPATLALLGIGGLLLRRSRKG